MHAWALLCGADFWSTFGRKNANLHDPYSTRMAALLEYRDHDVLANENTTLKTASQYLHDILAVLVRYNQAQKCLHMLPQKNCYKNFYLVEFSD